MKKIYSFLLAGGLLMSSSASAKVATATFEDLGLGADSYWCGDADEPVSSFKSGGFVFPNNFTPEWSSWAWCAYSSQTANDGTSWTDQFQSAPGGAYESDTFGVIFVSDYYGDWQISVDDPEGTTLSGTYITNSAYARYCILNGDGMSPAFSEGDWFKATFTGLDSEGNATGSVEFYLADYRSSDSADHYCLDKWEWCDLSALGKVNGISISLATTKSNEYGPTTPFYFCIDDLTAADSTGVTDAAAETVAIMASAGRIITEGAEGEAMTVATLEGRVIYNGAAVAALDVEPGIYVVRVADKTAKIAVR